jgi:hypothetical protein
MAATPPARERFDWLIFDSEVRISRFGPSHYISGAIASFLCLLPAPCKNLTIRSEVKVLMALTSNCAEFMGGTGTSGALTETFAHAETPSSSPS